jgi:NAD(P)H-hydrate epimerase
MIASGLMQDKDALGAAVAAVYAHGLSGDHAAGGLSERAMTAGDILKFLPEAIKELEGDEE